MHRISHHCKNRCFSSIPHCATGLGSFGTELAGAVPGAAGLAGAGVPPGAAGLPGATGAPSGEPGGVADGGAAGFSKGGSGGSEPLGSPPVRNSKGI